MPPALLGFVAAAPPAFELPPAVAPGEFFPLVPWGTFTLPRLLKWILGGEAAMSRLLIEPPISKMPI